jgi:hypothetical protein
MFYLCAKFLSHCDECAVLLYRLTVTTVTIPYRDCSTVSVAVLSAAMDMHASHHAISASSTPQHPPGTPQHPPGTPQHPPGTPQSPNTSTVICLHYTAHSACLTAASLAPSVPPSSARLSLPSFLLLLL